MPIDVSQRSSDEAFGAPERHSKIETSSVPEIDHRSGKVVIEAGRERRESRSAPPSRRFPLPLRPFFAVLGMNQSRRPH